jgi:hypothetical protein
VDEDPIDRLLVSLRDREHAVGQPGLLPQLGKEQRRRWVLLGRLEHEAVSAGDGAGEHPHRHHGREVEGRDAGHDAEGLKDRVDIDGGRGLFGVPTLEQVGHATGELDVLEAAANLALGVGEHLAVLGGDERRDLLAVPVDEFAQVEEHLGPLGQRSGAPAEICLLGARHRRVNVGCGGQVHEGRLLAEGRVEDRALAARRARHDPTADPMADPLHGCLLLGPVSRPHCSRFQAPNLLSVWACSPRP